MSLVHATQVSNIGEFIAELSGFAAIAEKTLSKIEQDPEGNKNLFSVFSERMIAIRGTAVQLNLPHIAHISELGEEIAVKAVDAKTRAHVRKCVGSLWDALTTVKYLLEHYAEKTTEEQQILTHRLEKTLAAMGGCRPSISTDEIEDLLKKRKN